MVLVLHILLSSLPFHLQQEIFLSCLMNFNLNYLVVKLCWKIIPRRYLRRLANLHYLINIGVHLDSTKSIDLVNPNILLVLSIHHILLVHNIHLGMAAPSTHVLEISLEMRINLYLRFLTKIVLSTRFVTSQTIKHWIAIIVWISPIKGDTHHLSWL